MAMAGTLRVGHVRVESLWDESGRKTKEEGEQYATCASRRFELAACDARTCMVGLEMGAFWAPRAVRYKRGAAWQQRRRAAPVERERSGGGGERERREVVENMVACRGGLRDEWRVNPIDQVGVFQVEGARGKKNPVDQVGIFQTTDMGETVLMENQVEEVCVSQPSGIGGVGEEATQLSSINARPRNPGKSTVGEMGPAAAAESRSRCDGDCDRKVGEDGEEADQQEAWSGSGEGGGIDRRESEKTRKGTWKKTRGSYGCDESRRRGVEDGGVEDHIWETEDVTRTSSEEKPRQSAIADRWDEVYGGRGMVTIAEEIQVRETGESNLKRGNISSTATERLAVAEGAAGVVGGGVGVGGEEGFGTDVQREGTRGEDSEEEADESGNHRLDGRVRWRASSSSSGKLRWRDLLNINALEEVHLMRAGSVADAHVLRRKGHLKEQDGFVEFIMSMHRTHSPLEVMMKMELWIREHMQDPERSTLRRLIPSVGIFYTPLHLVEAFKEYDEFASLSRRRYVPPNFAEIRHVANIAQVHSSAEKLSMITFDADGTLYADGHHIEKDNKMIAHIIALMQCGIHVAIVTAAGYPGEALRFERRVAGLLEAFQELQLPPRVTSLFYVMGGECNYLLRVGKDYHLEFVPDYLWKPAEMQNWKEEDIEALLGQAESALEAAAARLKLDVGIIRKERAVGAVPLHPTIYESLEEMALTVQIHLVGSKLPFCAFNGGNDVFVDIGNKSLGLAALMQYLGKQPAETLHIGDRFTVTGNDGATRERCPILWVANPEETIFFVRLLLRDIRLARLTPYLE
ncbi:hypothetical protein CBR_g9114 [Chara braunii]|uniref:IMP-specific 5'-nucleotidase 1 n=1 Tax=Chara braunii TaxID=69332 RepID=A0A388KNT3_CHABU|nr:hypothetical protein CBR_g9114 [Chara braunii]|eukprot:GBG71702.1 hypothetical protein CBR_g9114 [Chara braunii]